MQIEYVQKLYFGKYCYKIHVEVKGIVSQPTLWWTAWETPDEVKQVTSWCVNNLPAEDHKLIKRRMNTLPDDSPVLEAVWHVCVYCDQPDIRDQVVKKFGAQVVRISQPLDDDHKQNLQIRNVVQVKKELIYKQYSNVIYFKYDKTGEIHRWLHDYFQHNSLVRISKDSKWCKVYMSDDSDVSAIKLTWSDRIEYMRTIRLISEPT